MTVTVEKIALGSCDVTYNAVDMGSTKGGVTVEIKTEKYTVKVDQTGETPVKDIIIGTVVTVKVPMAETDLTKLQTLMPQSVLQAAAGSTPTGYFVDDVGGQAVGATTVVIKTGTNNPAAGDTFVFDGHTTRYRVTAYASGPKEVTFVNAGAGTGGLVAPIADSEAITFTKKAGGVEIRTGVNIDLLSYAFPLLLHPTGGSGTDFDFYAFKAAPTAEFSFKYNINEERVYEATFTCYPDTANSNRIATFGAPAA